MHASKSENANPHRLFRKRFTKLFNLISQGDSDADTVTGMVGLSMVEASLVPLQLRLKMPGKKVVRELLQKALWGNSSALNKLKNLIINNLLKKSDLVYVLKKLTAQCNSGNRFALELMEGIVLEAPEHVLSSVHKHVQEFCKTLGNYQALDVFKPSSLRLLPVPRPKNFPEDPTK